MPITSLNWLHSQPLYYSLIFYRSQETVPIFFYLFYIFSVNSYNPNDLDSIIALYIVICDRFIIIGIEGDGYENHF